MNINYMPGQPRFASTSPECSNLVTRHMSLQASESLGLALTELCSGANPCQGSSLSLSPLVWEQVQNHWVQLGSGRGMVTCYFTLCIVVPVILFIASYFKTSNLQSKEHHTQILACSMGGPSPLLVSYSEASWELLPSKLEAPIRWSWLRWFPAVSGCGMLLLALPASECGMLLLASAPVLWPGWVLLCPPSWWCGAISRCAVQLLTSVTSFFHKYLDAPWSWFQIAWRSLLYSLGHNCMKFGT